MWQFAPNERLWFSIQTLNTEQKARCLDAIVAWTLGKKPKVKNEEEISYSRDEMYVVVQILVYLWCWFTPEYMDF